MQYWEVKDQANSDVVVYKYQLSQMNLRDASCCRQRWTISVMNY